MPKASRTNAARPLAGSCRDRPPCTSAGTSEELKMEKPTEDQLAELKRLSKLARVPDDSEIVTSREEAEVRIRDLKEKARVE